LQAPLLLDDYAAQAAVCSSDLAPEMLEGLERLGLVGLAVMPGANRKPFGFSRPLVAAADYVGAVIRTHESKVGEATFTALGATPHVLSAAEMAATAHEQVDGMDLDIAAIAGWGYHGHLTSNVDLWPRTITIVANRRSFDRLGADEQELLRDAAARTGGRAAQALAGQDVRDRETRLPGVTIVDASPDHLSELRERVEPVHAELRRHPETSRIMQALEALVSSTRRA
jgi:TRAP-type C4-dicarboxylate transport system substrate-binding protein